MTADAVICVVFGWLVPGGFVGLVTRQEFEDSPRIPEGAAPDLGFLAGLLWPLTVAIFTGWLIWLCGRGLARSFAVLWEATAEDWWKASVGHWLFRRAVSLPRATARRTK